jgi:hypothetical protein
LPLEILHLIFRRFTFWELFDSVQLVVINLWSALRRFRSRISFLYFKNKKWLVQCWRAQQSIVVFPNFRPVTNAHILVVLRRAGTLPFLHSFACPCTHQLSFFSFVSHLFIFFIHFEIHLCIRSFVTI